MNCNEAREFLHAYVDDELDLAAALQIENHLCTCAQCRRALESLEAAKAAAAQPAVYRNAPEDLRADIRRMIRAQARVTWWDRPLALSGLAAVLIVLIGLGVFLRTLYSTGGQIDELVSSHVRSLEANHLLDIDSTDQHTVKPWFAGKLEFSPPVVDLSADGFPLVGGRLDFVENQRVAALVYHRNKHIINLFIWPGETESQVDVNNGFNLIRFPCKGMVCWAVSDVNAGELQRFCDLFAAQKSPSTRE
jgi:anti-sigma factor RsiW